jgi:hypothetical protein
MLPQPQAPPRLAPCTAASSFMTHCSLCLPCLPACLQGPADRGHLLPGGLPVWHYRLLPHRLLPQLVHGPGRRTHPGWVGGWLAGHYCLLGVGCWEPGATGAGHVPLLLMGAARGYIKRGGGPLPLRPASAAFPLRPTALPLAPLPPTARPPVCPLPGRAAELGLVLSMFFNYGGTVDNMVAYGKEQDPTWNADE